MAGPTGILAAGAPGNNFYTAEARSDLDGDGLPNIWGYVVPDPAGAAVVAGTWACPAGGTYNQLAGANLNTRLVGPCAVNMGQSIF